MNDYIINAFTKEGENTNLEVNNLNTTCITSKNNKFELDSNGNLTVQNLNVKNHNTNTDAIRDFIYPIGSIYVSVNDTSPSVLFGGTWEQIKDKFLLSCGDNYQSGITGGEEKHILTIQEMPKHSHDLIIHKGGNTDLVGVWGMNNGTASQNLAGGSSWGIKNSGGNIAHNNMPPYIAVYMWKRIS